MAVLTWDNAQPWDSPRTWDGFFDDGPPVPGVGSTVITSAPLLTLATVTAAPRSSGTTITAAPRGTATTITGAPL